MAEPKKLTPVETFKIQSQYLRGAIPEELTDGNNFFGKSSIQLLKHHGTYQQDNREERTAREGMKSLKNFSFMVRSRIPGGKLTSEQLLSEIDLGDELGNSTLRITTRQGLQLHGIPKHELKETIRRINEIKLSTLAACGDVQRNFMCCPAPKHGDPIYKEMQDLADTLAMHFAPRTKSYYEIWLKDQTTGEDKLVGEAVAAEGSGTEDRGSRSVPLAPPVLANGDSSSSGSNADSIEPIYGPTYLPRKFKTAVGLSTDNCVDLYSNDLALMAVVEAGKIVGYNVLAGGGMGVTPANKSTFPAVAKRLCYIRPDQAVDVATAIVKVQRDFGNRTDRKLARMKYLIADWGLEKFKAKVEEYYGAPLRAPHPADVTGHDDHMGWFEQGDGRWYYGLNVENGRIHDTDTMQLKTALRAVCRELKPGIRLTAHQSILFTDLTAEQRPRLESILRQHGVKLTEEISTVRRWSIACVALPTCGLAVTESERVLPGIIDQFEIELAKLGLGDEKFTMRMTGCPNGCARPYNCDVGLVGKAADRYTLLLGGRLLGDRLNFIYKELVPENEVVSTLMPLFVYFKSAREAGETFGDFCHRRGVADLQSWAEQYGQLANV